MKQIDRQIIEELVAKYGRNIVSEVAAKAKAKAASELTIVANAGLHPIPEEWVFGELFLASEGNLDFSSAESVQIQIEEILSGLRAKLSEKRWERIYLIPFGHAVVSMNIKMAVYRALRIETIDIFYFGEGRYASIEIDTRKLMLNKRGR